MLNPHGPLPFSAQVHPDAAPAAALTWDSRQAGPDTAFVALPGEHGHGNAWIQAALDAGAPFILTDLPRALDLFPRCVQVGDTALALRAWAKQERARNPLVVGVTGSVGKTTTKSYLAAALDAHYMPVFNTIPAISCFLIEHGASHRPLVVEMGIDHVGEMADLMDLVQPDVGVLTSIGAAHLEGLGSVETVAREKGKILAAPRAYLGLQAAAWFPGAGETYGFAGAGGTPQHCGEDLVISEQGADFRYHGVPVHLPLAAQVQAEAAVLGLALAEAQGLPLAEAAQRLSAVKVPSGRYQIHSGRYTVIDDAYNASPLAVQAALTALKNFRGRRIAVLGTMLELGDEASTLHAEVGAWAREAADLSYGVGPYAAALGDHSYATVTDLLNALRTDLRDGDVVLVKASRGISMTPQQRLAAGVGLDSVVRQLLEWRDQPQPTV